MNVRKLFLITLLVANGSCNAQQEIAVTPTITITSIDRPGIEKQKKEIQKYFDYNSKMRFVVRTAVIASAVALAAGVYYYYNKPLEQPAVTPVSPEDLNGRLQTLENGQKLLINRASQQTVAEKEVERLRQLIPEIPSSTSEAPTLLGSVFGSLKKGTKAVAGVTYTFGKNIFDFFVTHGPLTIASGIATAVVIRELPLITDVVGKTFTKYVLKPIERVCHPIDSKWFIDHHIPLVKTFEHAKITVQELPLINRQDTQEREHHVACLVTDINILVFQYTRLAAFLEIQSERLMKESKTSGLHLQKITSHFITTVQTFTKEIAALLVDQNYHVQIPALFLAFEEKVSKVMRHYALYERAVLLDILPPDKE